MAIGIPPSTPPKKLTPEEARAAALANRSGVFTLDQLRALGQTGDITADLTREGRLDYLSKIKSTKAFNAQEAQKAVDRSAIPKDTKAGYYQIPRQEGAEWYDPAVGYASPELTKWLSTGKDQFGDKAQAVFSGDTGDFHRQSASQGFARIAGSIIKNARSQNISLQQAMDQANNTGDYQRYVIGPDGKQISMDKVATTVLHPDVGYTDLAANRAGAFERMVGQSGKTSDELAKLLNVETDAALQAKADYFKTRGQAGTRLNYAYEKAIAPGSPVMMEYTPDQLASMSDVKYWQELRDSLSANAEKAYLSQQGIQKNRIARGLDPETGISVNEKKRINDIYNSIQDPAQKSMFIKYQDPGNLTADERADQIAARGPEMAAIAAENKKYDTQTKTHFYQGKYYPGEITVTSGAQVSTDPATGRSAFVGSTPYKLDYKAPKDTSGSIAARTGGAISGGLFGFIAGFSPSHPWGGVVGGVLGAWGGAGGWMPNFKSMGLKKGGLGIGSGFDEGRWGKPMAPGPEAMKSGVTSIMMSAMFGAASNYAKGISMRGPNMMGPTPSRYGMQF